MLGGASRPVPSCRNATVHAASTSGSIPCSSLNRPCKWSRSSHRLSCSAALQQSSLILPSQQLHQSRRLVTANGIRRSPVVTPDVVIGAGSEDEMHIDLFRYLLQNRIVFLGGYVNDKMATQVVGSLLALEAMDEKADIRLYINSTGGQPYSVIGLVDTIVSIKPEVQTLALGCCYSYSSVLLAAGTKGKRGAMKNTRIMMTQPMGGSQGDIYQIQKTVEELNAIYQLTARYYMQFTGMDQDTVERNTCRDYFMTPEEAVSNGLIDTVVRGKGDYKTPPSVIRNLKEAGLLDNLSGGLLRV